MNLRHIPNAITGLRLAMAPLLLWLLWARHFEAALGVALVAGASDLVDGFLAKRFGWQSRLGSLLDPIADKLMLGLAMLGLWLVAMLPAWLVGLVLVRDLVIVAGALAWWRVGGPFDGKPTWLGKLSTLSQLVLVLLCLMELAGWELPLRVRLEAILAVALLTFASGIDYVVRYGVRAWHATRNPAP
ncbi:MAG: CDP-alcohol phosphatidyltransferase family protein [Arenimonas sp.]|uniref:CDP-alcohol phosphatidyltransferase family protein n=1 Tax=Arenimonas sp. TaxID=1872635 RepID=UPI0025C1FD28|nr:CDP-alcohol phosphatidyltransferase family protein [Arenimonas sp.]MBW8367421.1 CDP-alcohol phosphatidyltransferase family protein [Arenimonas sp.]